MLMMFTFLLQAATLDADRATAAKTCGQATVLIGVGDDSPMRVGSRFTYLMMHAAAIDRGAVSFFDRVTALSEEAGKGTVLSAEAAKQLMPQCDLRFPIARSDAPARMPADGFRRDVLCLGTLSLLKGMAEEFNKNGDATPLARVNAGLEVVVGRLSDEALKKRGIDEARFTKILADEMTASLPNGNPLTIAAACGVTGI